MARETVVIEAKGRSGSFAVRLVASAAETAGVIAAVAAGERHWLPLFSRADVVALAPLAPGDYARARRQQIARTSIFLADRFAAALVVAADRQGLDVACNEAGDPAGWQLRPVELASRYVVAGADGVLRLRVEAAADWHRPETRRQVFEGDLAGLAVWAGGDRPLAIGG